MGLITALNAGAGSGSSTAITALTTAFQSIASDLVSLIGSIVPIAVGVLGAGMAIVFGVKWFKRLTNKA